jgi:hypothetical protein
MLGIKLQLVRFFLFVENLPGDDWGIGSASFVIPSSLLLCLRALNAVPVLLKGLVRLLYLVEPCP